MEKQTVFEFVKTVLPKVPGKRVKELLFNCTSYPCGPAEVVKAQVSRLCSMTDGTIEGCLAFSREEQEREYDEISDFDPDEENEEPPVLGI